MNPDPVPSFVGVSPDGEWWLFGSTAQPAQGGARIRICDFCDVSWGPDGNFLYLRFRGIGDMGGGKTFVIRLPAGQQLPVFPAAGLKSAEDIKALNVVAVIDMSGMSVFAPGPNPSVYAYTRMMVQRNLFRIPLN